MSIGLDDWLVSVCAYAAQNISGDPNTYVCHVKRLYILNYKHIMALVIVCVRSQTTCHTTVLHCVLRVLHFCCNMIYDLFSVDSNVHEFHSQHTRTRY